MVVSKKYPGYNYRDNAAIGHKPSEPYYNTVKFMSVQLRHKDNNHANHNRYTGNGEEYVFMISS